ncbi:Aldo/keto reductase subgroup [Penicillium atrosanguineum]|uniref:D-xylose reductase [NAD(P)H] n=1 Tax=Penicillium atrosanguineum TaxID=1132637 RepID=A0A9W9U8F4_9EURO|nr:cinnamoyl-CoA reductase [Penicillium atrosanguineum]KAJ5134120.1 Aldo/keto reductase subgroup [Penicillium atrosanguineum]KAJ5149281.1 Aldo/keto reductase subgroup [Penicillium atrosanguineum]KAJ5304594.1 cinnamoyl-CoA reductase [Penicillium atrosanguineum]KAJ5324062.1 Aldo/keto reductase subgroup [Penicillium atrosanguineum]
MSIKISDTLPLPNSSERIPRLGFGVYRSPSAQCVQSCLKALEVGYRHIDTAQFYGNESEVGEALRTSGLPRDQIFTTTKILSPAGSVEATYAKLLESVEKVGGPGGYVDLFLIHSSSSGSAGRKQLWQALERLHGEGKAKSIGVSNYGVQHIEEMKAYAKIWPPHVNQLELHPWCQQRTIDAYCKQHGVVVEAYSPIVRNNKANEPTLVEIAKRYNQSTQQVLIRYALQKRWVPLPKSDTAERIAANADVFGFDLSADDMDLLDSLDQGAAGAIVEAVENE